MLVAYSGGVDSTLLVKVAHDVLGPDVTAVTAISPSLPASAREEAARLARLIGVRHVEVETEELDDPRYGRNPLDRCYFCKGELFRKLQEVGRRLGIPAIVHGANLDDLGDFRPGMEAGKEAGARAPLVEAGLTKAEIRSISREFGLPNWDAPAQACLSSRIPHGIEVTRDRLAQIERAEEALRELGFRQFRVRHHNEVARLEVEPSELPRLVDPAIRGRIIQAVKGAGFRWVAVDLEGYRQGSLNPIDSPPSTCRGGKGPGAPRAADR